MSQETQSQSLESPEFISFVRTRLQNFVKGHNDVSNRLIAQNVGCSSTTVNLFINDNYNVSEAKLVELAHKFESYLNNFDEAKKVAVSGHLKFVMTSTAQTIFKTANYVIGYRKIGVIFGEPGCGKTIACEQFAMKNSTSILIKITPTTTRSSLLNMLCGELKISFTSRQLDISFQQIIKSLAGTNRLLMIDEGENLDSKCLEIVRRIQDFAGIPILICGTERILHRLKGFRGELAQLYSRIGVKCEIGMLSAADTKLILEANYPEALHYNDVFHSLSKRNGRLLEHLVDLCRLLTSTSKIKLNEDLIHTAARSLLT